ncbi:nitronate monooxygenase [Nesterenkonia sp. MY13]|uniref:Propionate 3-nitronate monooxygenase n=1 Tax=Nesterenkonia sedimenti TaxID=1463632 RepID=A0A7X8TLV2_9MICC|nr:nitronate monooxygenase [Nesterenkonia sedimenti]NLS11088.1 nitronate monooxygenase [Nesterenkonia sedimenti]
MTGPLLRSAKPLVAAPMAGGPSGVPLAEAVAGAGAFPFLAGGYKTPEALIEQIAQVRKLGVDFGVNLFVPDRMSVDPEVLANYAAELQPEADVYGLSLDPEPVEDEDYWQQKLDLLTENPVPVVSLTFGVPAAAEVQRLQAVGSTVLVSVTTAEEAATAQGLGADGLVVQGPLAGGHSATHDPSRIPETVETAQLVASIAEAVPLPVVGAGGVDGPATVRRILSAGAEAVAVGTLLLRTDEAGTSPTHRQALADPRFERTALTRAFTGRPARGLRNGFIDRHPEAPVAYPAVHHLTKGLRQQAGQAGDADRLHLWAGAGFRNAPAGPAAAVIDWLTDGL